MVALEYIPAPRGRSDGLQTSSIADLALEDLIVNAIVTNLRAAAGEAAQPGLAKGGQDFADAQMCDAPGG